MILQILGGISGLIIGLIILHLVVYLAFRAATIGILDARKHFIDKQKEKKDGAENKKEN